MIKLKNETKPTGNQDAFDRVWQHFVIEQNPFCVAYDGPTDPNRVVAARCLYRRSYSNETDEGLAETTKLGVNDGDCNGCAIGCMLPDSIASHAMGTISTLLDDRDIDDASWSYYETRRGIKGWLENVSPALLAALQSWHDTESVISIRADRMIAVESLLRIAIEYKLTMPTTLPAASPSGSSTTPTRISVSQTESDANV
jgi:hypothetical protein